MGDTWADRVARLCTSEFDKLGKTGKPTMSPHASEWTVIAAFLVENEKDDSVSVVSFGSGTKCIGKESLSAAGDILNDSHAEIVARRGFKSFLLSEIAKVAHGQESILEPARSKSDAELVPFKLKVENKIHLYISQTPCGDASIYESSTNHDTDDIHRTGAKPVAGEEADPKLPGAEYHKIGSLRTKPGRGPQTQSMSCSDKILRWNMLGVQGTLLSALVEPIFMKSIVVGEAEKETLASMSRALWDRVASEPQLFGKLSPRSEPSMYTSDVPMKHCVRVVTLTMEEKKGLKQTTKISACGTAISWVRSTPGSGPGCGVQEATIAATGRKMGTIKPKKRKREDGSEYLPDYPLKSRSSLCKAVIFAKYVAVCRMLERAHWKGIGSFTTQTTYADAKYKLADKTYMKRRSALMHTLQNWIEYPEELHAFSFIEEDVECQHKLLCKQMVVNS